ncbi:glycoside hydrolase family 28 protein [Pedobacter duraquae]|uniref:Glycosyl hydrolase family 28 n=1 Tax=Pedobacter duraquae TaxID=425511 RepID=A0A4R6IC53_9SPHI|nr:glycoside hydrolase family 28 protein [Pedobacter duraquae]TDO19058.1 glycosyl hydrolase family 28 [Pedobacter duraquae]
MRKKIIGFVLLAATIGANGQAKKANAFNWNNLPVVAKTSFKKDTVNIIRYKAVGDGVVLNTAAINQALLDCSKKGGGVVLVPAGMWMTGPLYLQSNVNLHLSKGATLMFTDDKSQYKIVAGDYEGRSAARNESPINGNGLTNIAITGNGVIDGNGDIWRAVGRGQVTEEHWKKKIASGGVLSTDGKSWYPSAQYKAAQEEGKSMLLVPGKKLNEFEDMKDFLRPNLLVLKNCKRILLEGVIFQNSGAWCLHPIVCEDLTIRKVMVKNPEYAQNGDGMDIESVKNFLIEDCVLDVGDDAICIKSGKDEEGRKRGVPTENGVIRGNTVYAGHGGVVVGSEMSGGVRNLFIENCTFLGTDKGLRFKSTRGRGGVVENIYARNIFMKNILQEAIFFDMWYFVKFATDSKRDQTPVVNEGTPVFKNMVFDRIFCNGAVKGIFIRGLSEMPIQNITVSNSVLVANTGVELSETAGINLKNLKLVTKSNIPVISVNNSKDFVVDGLQYVKGADVLLSLDGANVSKVSVSNTDGKLAKKDLELKNGATAGAVLFK